MTRVCACAVLCGLISINRSAERYRGFRLSGCRKSNYVVPQRQRGKRLLLYGMSQGGSGRGYHQQAELAVVQHEHYCCNTRTGVAMYFVVCSAASLEETTMMPKTPVAIPRCRAGRATQILQSLAAPSVSRSHGERGRRAVTVKT